MMTSERIMDLLDYLEINGFDPIGASDSRSEIVTLGHGLPEDYTSEQILDAWRSWPYPD